MASNKRLLFAILMTRSLMSLWGVYWGNVTKKKIKGITQMTLTVIVSVWVNTIQSLHKETTMGKPKKLWYTFKSCGYFSKISKVKSRKRSKCKRCQLRTPDLDRKTAHHCKECTKQICFQCSKLIFKNNCKIT